MSDLNTDPTTNKIAQNPTEAADYNQMRNMVRFWAENEDDPSETENESVVVSQLFSQWIQNVRPEALGTNKIRVPFSADRPPSLIIDGHMIQATVNIDSATITGGAGTLYIIASRLLKTFTITISTSATVGDDQRVVGSFGWDGSAIVSGSIESYELSGSGALVPSSDQVVKCWGKVSVTGVLLDGFGVESVSLTATGTFLITVDVSFLNTSYCIVATLSGSNNKIISGRNQALNQFEVYIQTTVGAASDNAFYFMTLGDI